MVAGSSPRAAASGAGHGTGRIRVRGALVLLASLLAFTAGAQAQTGAFKGLRLVVPYPAGGGTDALARTLAPELADALGQPVIVDNRPGANGIIGSEVVARARPDGATVLMTIASHAINPLLYQKLPYDTEADFVPITLVAEYPFVLVVHPALPARSVKEFVALARRRPGEIAYASSGSGSGPHLGMELLASMAGVSLIHVPYKGAGPATADLLGGQVQAMLNNFLASASQIRSGRLRPLAVTGARRSAAMPDLPTVAEAGVPGFEVNGWYGLLAPRGTPAGSVGALHEAVVRALRRPAVAERLATDGAIAVGSAPAVFAQTLRAEREKWARVIERARLRPESL
jgi:tripartite-type tricarboxylate transporter receptor subunit TctC